MAAKGETLLPPGRLADRIALGDKRGGPGEVTAPGLNEGERDQVDRQLVERTDGTGELDLADQDLALVFLLPQRDGGPLGHQAVLEPLADSDVGAGKGARRLPQRRRRG